LHKIKLLIVAWFSEWNERYDASKVYLKMPDKFQIVLFLQTVFYSGAVTVSTA